MYQHIAVECLRCGHCASISERELHDRGYAADTSLVTLTKRMVCKECGSKALRAFRYEDDDARRYLQPHDNDNVGDGSG